MKLRIGFISNSSSTSYLIVTTKTVSDRAKEGMTSEELRALDEALFSERFLGADTVQCEVTDNYGDTYIWDTSVDSFESEPDTVVGATEKWIKRVKEIANDNEIYERESGGC